MRQPCNAAGCTTLIPKRRLMCQRHWLLVSLPLRFRFWDTYQLGQEHSGHVSAAHLVVAHEAIAEVAAKEGRRETAREHREYAAVQQAKNGIPTFGLLAHL